MKPFLVSPRAPFRVGRGLESSLASCSRKDVSTTEATECLSSTLPPIFGAADCRRDDIRRVTFGTKGKGTRAGTSCKPDSGPVRSTRNRRRPRGEVFGSWKVRVSTRRLNGSVFVRAGARRQRSRWERGPSRPHGFRLAPQRGGGHRHRENLTDFPRGNRMGRGRIRRPVPPGNRLRRPNRARHRLRRAHVSIRRLQISGSMGIVRRSFCGGWR
jgi:hypothetical protein